MLQLQNDMTSQRRFVPLALETRPNDLDILFNFIEQFVFPGLPNELQETLTQTARTILETRPNDLDALFNFIGRFIFPNILPERREVFANETVRIISPQILGNLKSCFSLLNSRVFDSLPVESKEIIAIQMTESILQRGSYVLHASLGFAHLALPRLPSGYQKAFVIRIIEFLSTTISENLSEFIYFMTHINVADLSQTQRERFAAQMLETRSNNLGMIFSFEGSPLFNQLAPLNKEIFAVRAIEIIEPEISKNLELCSNLEKSFLFSIL
ncbi:MAG: hypothetical protein LBJ93_01890, partial [Clostridiales bacterium]|nr:hypothetical protein [Clostridiales bacterium]